MKYSVTLIITTWNSLNYLKICMDFIKKYTNVPYKIVIVNNGSTDGTKQYLKGVDAQVINNSTNVGVIKALFQAERLVDTPYIVSINDDVLVSPEWLENLIKIYKDNSAVKILAPIKPATNLIYPYSGESSRIVWERIKRNNEDEHPLGLLEKFCGGKPYAQLVKDFKSANNFGDEVLESPPDFLAGCCVFVEKKFMHEIGGFVDLRFKLYGCEDVDRCWRIAGAGFEVMRTSKVFVHHFEGASVDRNNLKWKRLIKSNNQLLVEKWKETFWNTFGKKKELYGTISAAVEKHWLFGWILESLEPNHIPDEFRKEVADYLAKREFKLKDD